MNSRTRRQQGFTLTEVIVATAIFAIIFVAALMIYDRSNRVFKTGVESGDMQQQVRIAFDKMVADVRMAGYDFDRDGIPSTKGRYQQPDEQIEFAAPGAVTIRGNFDAQLDAVTDNGREPAYQPGTGQFPVVTTGNDEIVTYALRSVNGPNNDTIEFWADTRKPRQTFPGGGGVDEQKVSIPNVDLCTAGCMNPPYTLYRITLQDADLVNPSAEASFLFTPIAENIRSMRLSYFEDAQGKTPIVPNSGTGQYKVSGSGTTAAALAARTLRERINSLRIELVGMNAVPDFSYTSPIEEALDAGKQVAAAKKYRQYALDSLVAPRNIGRRGMVEYDTNPPGQPKINKVCSGPCGYAYLEWEAPPTGIVDNYAIIYDTSLTGSYSSTVQHLGNVLSGFAGPLDPFQSYFFRVVALNSFGSFRSDPSNPALQPINHTKPTPPADMVASGNGTIPVEPSQISLAWTAPKTNELSPTPQTSCSVPLETIQMIYETTHFRLARYESPVTENASPPFVVPPASATISNLTVNAPGEVAMDTVGNSTFIDQTQKLNCVPYYYKVRAVEKCVAAPSLNSTGNISDAMSGWSMEFMGQSDAVAAPAQPDGFTILAGSSCVIDPCTINLQWNAVTADTASPANPIYVRDYEIRRQLIQDTTVLEEVPIAVVDAVYDDATVKYTDKPAQPAAGTFYRYDVLAKQCAFDSVYSAFRDYPCTTMTIIPPATGLLDGSGTAADPWLISGPSGSMTVETDTPIQSITGKLYTADGTFVGDLPPTSQPSTTTAIFDVPMSSPGTTFRLDVILVDINGCTITEGRYFEDSPSGCCLAPRMIDATTTFDNSIVTQGTSSKHLVVKFSNLCGDQLTLTGLSIGFNNLGNQFLETITYPTTTGGTTTATLNQPSPVNVLSFPAGAVTTIPGGDSSLKITLQFNKDIAPSGLSFCGIYDRPGASVPETGTVCKIAQSPTGACN